MRTGNKNIDKHGLNYQHKKTSNSDDDVSAIIIRHYFNGLMAVLDILSW